MHGSVGRSNTRRGNGLDTEKWKKGSLPCVALCFGHTFSEVSKVWGGLCTKAVDTLGSC
jgi:hypothetical protein